MRLNLKKICTYTIILISAALIACDGGGGGDPEKTTTVNVTGISVTPETGTILTGNTLQLSALVAPSGATNKSVTWSSDNESVATVNASGVVTAGTTTGTATITATTDDGGITDTCTITVTDEEVHVTTITVTPETKSINVGEQFTAAVEFTPLDTTDSGIVWSTSDAGVATVSNGIVTGVGAGTATITATSTYSSAINDTCAVTVTDPGVSGTYTVELTIGGESKEEDNIWIIKQSGSNVNFIYGNIPEGSAMTISGTTMTWAGEWDEEEDGVTSHYVLDLPCTISGNTISGTGTLKETADGVTTTYTITLTMTRTSTSTEIPVFNIPEAVTDITVDGDYADWSGVSTFMTDTTGDSEGDGADIQTIKLARDETNVYCLVTFADNFTTNDIFSLTFDIGDEEGNQVGIMYNAGMGKFTVNGADGTGTVNVTGKYIEFSFEYSTVIDLDTYYNGGAYTQENGSEDPSDDVEKSGGYTVLPTLVK